MKKFYIWYIVVGGWLLVLTVLLGTNDLLRLESQPNPVLRVPQDYQTIQAAIDAAPDGATILISPGVYTVNLIIEKSLIIQGSGMDQTILVPPWNAVISVGVPIFRVRASESREINVDIRRLTVSQPLDPPPQPLAGMRFLSYGIGAETAQNISLAIEQTKWRGMTTVIRALALKRLEVRDNIFEKSFNVFSRDFDQQTELFGYNVNVEKGSIEQNFFLHGGGISLQGKHIQVRRNVIVHQLYRGEDGRYYRSGQAIEIDPMEDGWVEIAENVVMGSEGIMITPIGRRTTTNIHNNVLQSTNTNIRIVPGFWHPWWPDRMGQYVDVTIAGNIITGGCIGITLTLWSIGEEGSKTEILGGRVQIHNNEIAATGTCSSSGGILLTTFDPHIPIRESVTVDISKNEVGLHHGWGMALTDYSGKTCAHLQKEIVITGTNNRFWNNIKGDLCPADYPWPPGFRK